jgi:hypothetical protein
MSENGQSTFRFYPRPEAHAMNWADLLTPVQRAIRALLLRIAGATQGATSCRAGFAPARINKPFTAH